MTRNRRRATRLLMLVSLSTVLLLVLVACSGPGNGDDPTATAPVATQTPAEPTATPEPPTATPEPEPTATSTPELTATPEPTATSTSEPTETPVPPEPTATQTPTPPLPETGGSALTIEGKAIHKIVAGNASASILYALTDVGISRSNDGGRTWFASGTAPEGNLVVALNNPDVLYGGERGSCGMGPSEVPLTRSTDAGRTWQTFEGGESVEAYLIEADQNSTLIGADCGLSISVDGGQSWTLIPGSEGMDFFSAYAAGETLDSVILAVGVTEGGTGRLVVVDVSDPGVIQINAALAQFWGSAPVAWFGDRVVIATAARVGVSDDGGDTWNWSRTGLEDVTYSVDPLLEGIPEDENELNALFTVAAIDPTNPDRIWIGGNNGAFLSTDAGQTWSQVGDTALIDSIVITPDRVYISAGGSTTAWGLEGE